MCLGEITKYLIDTLWCGDYLQCVMDSSVATDRARDAFREKGSPRAEVIPREAWTPAQGRSVELGQHPIYFENFLFFLMIFNIFY